MGIIKASMARRSLVCGASPRVWTGHDRTNARETSRYGVAEYGKIPARLGRGEVGSRLKFTQEYLEFYLYSNVGVFPPA